MSKYKKIIKNYRKDAIDTFRGYKKLAERAIDQVRSNPNLLRACFKSAGLALWKTSAQ